MISDGILKTTAKSQAVSSMAVAGCEPFHLCQFGSHHRLATPLAPWERLKIGGGTPPILTRHGWLTVCHGVSELSAYSGSTRRELCYSAGVLALSEELPQVIRYRSPEPVLTPELRRNARGSSPTSCFLPPSIGATISAPRIASTFIMGWPTIGSAWRDSMYLSACRQVHAPTHHKRRSKDFSSAVRLKAHVETRDRNGGPNSKPTTANASARSQRMQVGLLARHVHRRRIA
jgi:hypothetical protein